MIELKNKEDFVNLIHIDMIPDDKFYKKLYGYSVYDKTFEIDILWMFYSLGREDLINSYRIWEKEFEKQHEIIMKNVKDYYIEKIDERYNREVQKYQRLKKYGC